jgi:NAD dependent epimerase/dehydratase family enzyme
LDSRDDLCTIYLEAIENVAVNGAYNAAITDDTTNSSFSDTLARLWI